MARHISICIPTYEMKGKGSVFLKQNLDVLASQSFKDFEVIVSDHSLADDIASLCAEYSDTLDIKYFRNESKRGSSSANVNFAMEKASGKILRIIFQDDYLAHEDALKDVAGAFDLNKDSWLAVPCAHTRDGKEVQDPHRPSWHDRIYAGKNTIGSPSVIAVRKNGHPFFDENLIWLMDVDFYHSCFSLFGSPKILAGDANVISRIGEHQVTNTLATDKIRVREYAYSLRKRHDPRRFILVPWANAKLLAKKLIKRT